MFPEIRFGCVLNHQRLDGVAILGLRRIRVCQGQVHQALANVDGHLKHL